MLSLFQRLPLASFCYRKKKQKLSAATRLPLGGRLRREAVVRGSFICLAKNFQTKGQLHFRLKSFRANQSRPSFASLSLGTFPPRGRLCFRRSSCFPLRGEWREAPREDMTELDLFSRLSPTASPKGKPRITARNPEEKSMSRPSFALLSLGTFPPRGRLNFCRIHGFPSGGGSAERRW